MRSRDIPARSAIGLTLLAAGFLVCQGESGAQTYPQRPVRIVVNVGAGGGVDTIARIVAQQFVATWNQPFVVDNRPGAGGSIGAEAVAKAAPDGYTLLVSSSSVITNAAMRPEGYDPVRDLQAVTRFISSPYVIAVNPAAPVAKLADLIALAKSKPDRVSFSSAGGVGSITHLGPELLGVLAGVRMLHVPFKGTGGAYAAVASGEADWCMGNPVSIMPIIKAGRLKPIAVTSLTRLKGFPEIPTVAESGVPGFEVVGWFGMFAPAGTPLAVANALRAQASEKLHSAEIARQMEREGSEVVVNSPQAFAAEVKSELAKWRELVAKRNIKL